jgi:colicin import membrane protein
MNARFKNLMMTNLEDPFRKALIYSVCLHLFLVVLSIILTKFDVASLFKSGNKKVKMIKSAVRVDVVGMPKYTVQELKKMKLPPISTKVKTPPPSKSYNKRTMVGPDSDLSFKKLGKKKNLSALLKNISKKKIKVKKKTGKKKKSKVAKKENDGIAGDLNQLILEGNKVSKGTALVGESSEEISLEFEQYANSIPDIVRKYWKLPTYLMDTDLKCRIRVFISAKGRLLNAEIFETSGVEEYDEKALKSVTDAKTFPVPPVSITHRVSAGELILGFPL